MIQRIQSIYLLLVIFLSIGAPFFFKLWVEADNEVFAFDLFAYESILYKLVPISFIISALLALITIFRYNDRQQQFVLGRIIILINLFLLGILMVSTTSCQRGSGCPAQDAATVRTDKKGKLSTKRGSSKLFPKQMRKRKKR